MEFLMRLALAVVFFVALANRGFAQEPKEHQTALKGTHASMAMVSAKVDQVFNFVDEDGYQFIAYQVTYKGHPIIVEDAIGNTNIPVGSEIRFLVIRHDLSKSPNGGKKLVSFIVGKQ
jgi:hypothetical protein